MAQILLGEPVAAAIDEKMALRRIALKNKGITPTLAIVRVGDRGDDISYERSVMNHCEGVGVEVRQVLLPAGTTEDALVQEIKNLNTDASIHGVLLFRPLPEEIDDDRVRNALSPEKDVDGITDSSLIGVFTGSGVGFPPCTPQACIEIMDHYSIDLRGKKAVVVGRSLVVGRPAAMMLLSRNATATICHTKTVDMPAVCREAEILIISAGHASMIGKEYLSVGQVVIDVGINVNEDGSLSGDVNFEEADSIVDAITPVPGGVGTVTASVLIKHVLEAAEKRAETKCGPAI